MVQPAQITVDTDVIRDRPLHFNFDTLRGGLTHVNRLGFLKVVTRGVLDRHNGIALQTFVGRIEVGSVQTERAIKQIGLHADLDVFVLFRIVRRARSRGAAGLREASRHKACRKTGIAHDVISELVVRHHSEGRLGPRLRVLLDVTKGRFRQWVSKGPLSLVQRDEVTDRIGSSTQVLADEVLFIMGIAKATGQGQTISHLERPIGISGPRAAILRGVLNFKGVAVEIRTSQRQEEPEACKHIELEIIRVGRSARDKVEGAVVLTGHTQLQLSRVSGRISARVIQ